MNSVSNFSRNPESYRCIDELQAFASSSCLVKLNISNNILSSAALLSHVMAVNQIVELNMFGCNRQVSFNFPIVPYLIFVDNLDSLNGHSLSTNIPPIQIILHHEYVGFASSN
ncbi:unnamed protein product [Rotaria sp. Silwood2]|nr:unnamed protein product [Rotaria sp. Silwood2]CAF3193405.1 unnamed protein product [Rotaria sp. Silwood2]CAF4239119.1 unnamed protein product [Rotaria sp. Silwood2]CAF4269853.1 unnamed protein product [Rotaria sp. Silwood2]